MGCGASSALSHPEKGGMPEEHESLNATQDQKFPSKENGCPSNVINGTTQRKEAKMRGSNQGEDILTLSSNDNIAASAPQQGENNASNKNNNNNNNNNNKNNNTNNTNNDNIIDEIKKNNNLDDNNISMSELQQFEPSSISSFDQVQPLQAQNSITNSESITSKKDITFEEALAIVTQQLAQRQREGVSKVTKEEAERVVLMARELDNLKQMMRRSKYTVVGTWGIVENENMLGRFAQQLYDELLTANPRLRVYFYGVDLEEQSQTLLRMLSTAVRLYDKPQAMVDMLTKAGGRHRGYGVTKDTFVEMQNAFMKVFPKFIGEDVFSAAEDEWRKFWKLMLDLLEHGSVTTEGERYGKMYEEQNTKKLQNDFKLIVERQNKCDLRHQFVGTMYAKAIEMHGDLSRFDALKDLRASTRVFQSFIKLIKNLNDREWSQKYMHELGVRHVDYGVTVENMKSFTEPFLFACRHFLEDEWNVSMESRFYAVFRYMVDGITSGILDVMENKKYEKETANTNTFCLMFTEIEGSNRLWQENSQAMSEAVKQHHNMIRRLITEYGAYEVKTIGDSFMIALKDIFLGAKLALAIQLELIRMAPIASHFTMIENTEGRGDPFAWSAHTLRVRIALEHCTNAIATYDTIHKRYDYYGLSVDRCSRIENVTCGGQILMSMESYDELTRMPEFHEEPCPSSLRALSVVGPSCKLDKSGLDNFVTVSDMGVAKLKGIRDPVHLVSLVPRCLDKREFVDKIGKLAQRVRI